MRIYTEFDWWNVSLGKFHCEHIGSVISFKLTHSILIRMNIFRTTTDWKHWESSRFSKWNVMEVFYILIQCIGVQHKIFQLIRKHCNNWVIQDQNLYRYHTTLRLMRFFSVAFSRAKNVIPFRCAVESIVTNFTLVKRSDILSGPASVVKIL